MKAAQKASASPEKPWMKNLGKPQGPREERQQIEERVEEAFEQIDAEIWES
jgi:hypothetical protein